MQARQISWAPRGFAALAAIAVSAATATAQCNVTWQRPSGFAVEGEVRALLRWDPDGPGPRGEGIVAAGSFAYAGGLPAGNVALYDPQTDRWSTLAGGTDGAVVALAVLPNNDLVASGSFNRAGGAPVGKLARWDGTAWQQFGSGVTGNIVDRLLVTAAGDLLIGGTVSLVGGQQTRHVALWDGRAWSPIGNSLPLTRNWSSVVGLLQLANGDIVVAGAPGETLQWFYRWTGTGWVVPPGTPPTVVGPIAAATVGSGAMFSMSVPSAMLYFDGTTWSVLPPDGGAECLLELPNGDVLSGAAPLGTARVSRLRNGVWSRLGMTVGDSARVRALVAMPSTGSGDFAIGGTFGMVDHAPAQSVARFRQDGWVANPSLPFDSSVTCVSTTSTGDIVVGGGFGRVGGQVAMHVARFDQATSRWQSTNGAGLPFSPTSVAAMEDGTLYASEPTRGVFRLSGNSWTSVLSTADASPYRLIPTPDGRLLVITTADLRIFDGRSWRVISSSVITAAMLPNGDIVAGGLDSAFGVNCPVARWNGTAWSPLAQPNVIDRAVQAILVLPSGDLVIGGGFLNPGRRVARIVGNTVLPIGAGFSSGEVTRLLRAPNGDIIAIGTFGAPGIARWDGTSWSPLRDLPPTLITTRDAAMHPSGELILVGSHTSVTPFFTRQRASCPALAVSVAPACTPAQGLLVATDWPHIGTTFRTRGSALPAAAFALVVTGATQATVPLDSLLPQGRPGCWLMVQPDLLTLVPVRGRTAELALTVPNSPALVGAQFRQQMLPLEVDSFGQLVAVTATNSLAMQIGFAPQ